ncbi:DUF72 domain-containing protein [Bryobacter aggregatus]|uniref:DUF72 domain-containing protein n=1 Tax=Bryobacter aggregatus TaxID=360054 RepID=UPI00068E498F|nr:DUF72 domain-containing protein [Bryobacter aggregatus]
MNLPTTGPIHCGPSGWAHAQWQGVFYPNLKSKAFHQLEFTSRFFNSVELSSSFYGPLRPELSQLWCRQVRENAEFQFTARLWKKLTHEAQVDAKDIAAFREGIRPIEEAGKLGALLMQFPSSFRFTAENRTRFIELRRQLKGLPLVAEFRHSSWAEEDALGTLIDYHVGFCNIDQPDHARAMPPTSFQTSPIAYVRLTGRALSGPYQYDLDELSEWTHRIRKASRYAKRTFVVMANDPGARSLVNAFQMKQLLGMSEVRAPYELVRRFAAELGNIRLDRPVQTDLFGSVAA